MLPWLHFWHNRSLASLRPAGWEPSSLCSADDGGAVGKKVGGPMEVGSSFILHGGANEIDIATVLGVGIFRTMRKEPCFAWELILESDTGSFRDLV